MEDAMTDFGYIIGALIGLAGVTWAAWLTWRSTNIQIRMEAQDREAAARTEFVQQLQAEINRLREDLATRDQQARESYEQIKELRRLVLNLQDDQHTLRVRMAQLQTGVQVLMEQLDHHDIKPLWRPSFPLGAPEVDGE
jgi:predicted nuclease with TOPRIM domain